MKQNRPGKEIVKLLKSGATPKNIALQFSVRGSSIRYWANKLGIPPFKRGRPLRKEGDPRNRNLKSKERAVAKEMRHTGKTFKEIGKALGVTRQRAHQYFLTADA